MVGSFNAGTLPDTHQPYTAANLAEARAEPLAPHQVRKLRDGAAGAGGSAGKERVMKATRLATATALAGGGAAASPS